MVLDGQLLPIVVVARVREPVEEIGRQRSGAALDPAGRLVKERVVEERVMGEWKRPDALERVGILHDAAVERVLGQPGRPGLIEPLLERTPLVSPAVVVVARVYVRVDSVQVRRRTD